MFNFLKGKKTEIGITVDRMNGIYYPGETIRVTVEIQPDSDLKLQSAQLELRGTEQYKYTSRSTSTDSDGKTVESESEQWGYHNFYSNIEKFLGETSLAGSKPQPYRFEMSLPADALPSCNGEIERIYWGFHVKLNRRMATDLHAEAVVVVHTLPANSLTLAGEYGGSSEPKETELVLILPQLEATVGQSFNGQLRIVPYKNFASGVRIELVRVESVYCDCGNYRETAFPVKLAENTDFSANQQVILPFQVSVPADAAPSVETNNAHIHWLIRGVLDRRLRTDTTVEQEIVVYSAKV